MRIVIPTHGRVLRQTTLYALPPELRREVLLVASTPRDAADLLAAHGQELRSPKSVVVAPVKTIADKRQWILENVKDNVFMLDDDMVFYKRCAFLRREFIGGRWKAIPGHKTLSLDYVTPQGIVDLFGRLGEELSNQYPVVGISSRFGNDLEELDWKSGANRIMHGFGYNRKTLLKQGFKFNAVQFREDFHMALTMLRAGYESLQCYDWCVAPGAYGADGGCSAERTVAASDAAAEVLARLHPGFVRVVDKDYKGTPRKEVVVSWKKALESGRSAAR